MPWHRAAICKIQRNHTFRAMHRPRARTVPGSLLGGKPMCRASEREEAAGSLLWNVDGMCGKPAPPSLRLATLPLSLTPSPPSNLAWRATSRGVTTLMRCCCVASE